MSSTMNWLIPDQVLEVTMPQNTTDEFILGFDAEMIALLDSASHPIHLIVDLHSMKVYPTISIIMNLKYYNHPKLGRLIMLGLTTNPIVRFITNLVNHGNDANLKAFATLEEAMAYLMAVEHI